MNKSLWLTFWEPPCRL